jgi:hypothetical protein
MKNSTVPLGRNWSAQIRNTRHLPPSPPVVQRLNLTITDDEARQGGAQGHEAGVGDSPKAKRNDGAHCARDLMAAALAQRETTVRGLTGGH